MRQHEAVAVGFAVLSRAHTGSRILRSSHIGAQSLDVGLCDSHHKRHFESVSRAWVLAPNHLLC